MSLTRFLQQKEANDLLRKQTKILAEMAGVEGPKTAREQSTEITWRNVLDKKAKGQALNWVDKYSVWGTDCPPAIRQEYLQKTQRNDKIDVVEGMTDKEVRWMRAEPKEEPVEAHKIERPSDV